MRYQPINRRHFLQGVGCSLALPFLPSLASRADAAPFAGPKFFLALGTRHGGVPIDDCLNARQIVEPVQLVLQGGVHEFRATLEHLVQIVCQLLMIRLQTRPIGFERLTISGLLLARRPLGELLLAALLVTAVAGGTWYFALDRYLTDLYERGQRTQDLTVAACSG